MRPERQPSQAYRENSDCLGKLSKVQLVCGLEEDAAEQLEVALIDFLTDFVPSGRCNRIRR